MKANEQMGIIFLSVYGREQLFSEEELISILEKYDQIKEKYYQIRWTDSKQKTSQTVETPTEGKWFEVNPLAIDQNLFKEKRSDSMQEKTRQLILKAFVELKKHPERNKAFRTLIPEKTWNYSTVKNLKKMASQFGDHIADWVEQALEWAQRIANGESWEDICNKEDNVANWWSRLVIWKNGQVRLVGGSSDSGLPASDVSDFYYGDLDVIYCKVPLVVL